MSKSPIINEEVRMMSIRNLKGKTFYIPAYQRGFRWNKQQVKELIDDLHDFWRKKSKREHESYCLQSIVVRNLGNNEFEVVDGQQRLTALWLLSICYKLSGNYENDGIFYNIIYKEKIDYSTLISEINSIETLEGKDGIKINENDIDSQNLWSIFEYIINDYKCYNNNTPSSMKNVLPRIFNDLFQQEFDIQVIWDELICEGVDEDSPELSSAVIDKFTNINANKIALTEAELIKAHLLSNVSDKHATAHMWETIERGLNNDLFWYFFALNDNKYQTRIDYLFDIWYKTRDVNVEQGDHEISRAAQKKIYNGDKKKNADDLWQKIVQIYETLLDWYDDYFLYHTIGLLIELHNKKEAAELIKDLYHDYIGEGEEVRITKTIFNKKLLKRIIENNELKSILAGEDKKTLVTNPDDLFLIKLNYEDNKKIIKHILLLYNISLLVNAQAISPQNKYERFPFDYYKNKKNPIEIEHINPQHPEEAENTENLADIDRFDNLTLLDKDLNIRYSNYALNKKRDHLISAVFGLPVPADDNDNTNDDLSYYEKSVILPGTRWVFLREYNQPDDKNYWSQKDREEYINSVQNSIFYYLSGKVEIKE